jgi:site-specific recombinase XerD
MWFREAGACEGPHCTNIVPAGMVFAHQTHWYCKDNCRRAAKNLRRRNDKHYVGICEYCQGPILVCNPALTAQRFCSVEHFRAADNDRIMGGTGPLGLILVEYTIGNQFYAQSSIQGAKTNLARAARFFHGELKLNSWEDVRPEHISKLINAEKKRGMKSTNIIGHLATFFGWLIAVKGIYILNPVIRKFHKQKSHQNAPRPFSDEQIAAAWQTVENTGDVALMLAFAIGEECGLRGGETSNVRLSDVDTEHQTIHVRLPTKNGVERTVPYHDKVARCLDLWRPLRNAKCGHDHLLHGERGAAWNIRSLDGRFSDVFLQISANAIKFCYHRLRHTWATRLYNAGMDLAVLQKLGGWLCLATLQVYVQVKPETISRQYEQAYEEMKKRSQEPAEEIISMDDFLGMDDDGDATNL